MTQIERLQARIRELEHQIETLNLDNVEGKVKIGLSEKDGKKYWCLSIERDRRVTGSKNYAKSWQKIYVSERRQDVIAFTEQLMDDLAVVYERAEQEGNRDDEA